MIGSELSAGGALSVVDDTRDEAVVREAFRIDGVVARVRNGVGALSLSAGVRIIGQLAIVPVAMVGWGAEHYGEWIVLAGLVGFLRFTDMGLQTYVVNRLCASYSTDQRAEAERLLQSALRLEIPLVLLLMCLLSAALFLFPVHQLLSLQIVGGPEAGLTLSLLGFELLLGIPMGVVAGVYRATERLTRGALIGSVQTIVQTGFVLALIASHQSFVVVAAARVVTAVAISTWIVFDLKRLYPWLRLMPRNGNVREGIAMVGPGLLFLFFPLADFLSTQASVVILQSAENGTVVAQFSTHRTAVNIAQMASGLVINAIWPELTVLYARGAEEQLRRLQRSLVRHHAWMVVVVTFVTLPFLPWVYSSWTAGRLVIEPLTLSLLIGRVVLWGFWGPNMTLLQATNRHRAAAFVVLGSAILSVGFTLLLVPRFGMPGAAAAMLLGDLCLAAWLIPLISIRATGDRLRTLLHELARDLIPDIGIPVLIGLVAWHLLPEGVGRQLGAAAFAMIWACLAACHHFAVSPSYLAKQLRTAAGRGGIANFITSDHGSR